MTAAAQYSQVLLAPWRQRDRSAPWGRRALYVLMLACIAACLVFMPSEISWRVALGIAVVILYGIWMAVGAHLQEQNHPHAAHHVPGHLRRLRHAALLGWALCALATTLLARAALWPMGEWPLLLLANASIAVCLLWATRVWRICTMAIVMSPLISDWAAHFKPLWTWLASLWQGQPLALLAVSLLVQAWLVTLAFGAGGSRHQVRYARQSVMRQAMRLQMAGQPMPASAWAGPFERLLRPFQHVTSGWLTHLLTRANTGRSSIMARAEVVLHGPLHWLPTLMLLVTILSIALLCFGAAFVWAGPRIAKAIEHGSFGMCIGLASVGLNPAFGLPGALWRSRREQALLRLLPGMPQGAALNRAVAARQLRDFGVAWLLTTAILLAVDTGTQHALLLCLPLGALPLAILSLTRRFATMRAPSQLTAVLPVLGFFLLAVALYAVNWALGVPLPAIAAGVLAVSAALLAWRWQALGKAPSALPVGWLA
ncbi:MULTISPECIES: hypothetical protein [unclassified Roseateles]|uniref:hypothetical protein n=1 Tax=unclassified Roseateles TaxID=2626991 RepID=UPI0006F1C550|nr:MULTISPECIES: hypothetical protein [unclassified Roseateles]KQW46562.1 hypothetical protein ASC81_09195 [Pelomonas sp. Root405]KRA73613.1 hypothetical protein ASD88_09195 [Pelomonas sp. Root662]